MSDRGHSGVMEGSQRGHRGVMERAQQPAIDSGSIAYHRDCHVISETHGYMLIPRR